MQEGEVLGEGEGRKSLGEARRNVVEEAEGKELGFGEGNVRGEKGRTERIEGRRKRRRE